jgi:hypothetical protein
MALIHQLQLLGHSYYRSCQTGGRQGVVELQSPVSTNDIPAELPVPSRDAQLAFIVKYTCKKFYHNKYKQGKVHPRTGTEALYRPHGLYRACTLLIHDHGTRRG